MMPRLDGYEVLADVRANSLTQFVPFIFLTAKAARDDLRAGMELGADDYLTKPFARLDLLRAIEKRLALKEAQEQEHQEQLAEFKAALSHERGQRLLTERLIAMFSSDFRSPVGGILTSAQLLNDFAEHVDEGRRAAHLGRIEMSARHLLQMLDDMLIVARLENGSLRFSPEPLEVGEFIGRIVDEFQIVHGETHPLQYACQFADSVPVDSRLIRQIAVNLIRSAIKASPTDSTVLVTLNESRGGCILTVQYEVVETPEAEQAHAAAEYSGGSHPDDRLEEGLGLAIVNQAVELHGGFLQIEKLAGVAIKASVTFPAR
jgi:signal transduction histidine kinase